MIQKNTPLRRSALIYTATSAGCSLLAIVLRLLSLILCYDASIGYFPKGAALPILSDLFGTASIVAFAVLSFLWFRKKEMSYAKSPSLAIKITAALAAVLSLLLGIYDLKASASVLDLLLCFGACLYFLLVLTGKTTPALSLVFGFCAILRLLGALADSYMDFLVPMNSPEKIWLYVGAVAGMFFLVCEIRALVTKPYTATWFFSAAAAMMIAASASIALIVGNLASRFYATPTHSALLTALLLLAIAIYAGARLVTVALNPEPPVEEEAVEEIQESEENEENEKIEEITEPEKTAEPDNE